MWNELIGSSLKLPGGSLIFNTLQQQQQQLSQFTPQQSQQPTTSSPQQPGEQVCAFQPFICFVLQNCNFFFLIPTIFDMVLVQTDNSYSAFIISSSGQLLGTYFKFFFCPCSPYIFCPVIILLFAVFCLCWNRNVHIIMKLRAKER